MTISDFDGASFWPAVRAWVAARGIEPISDGEPEPEIWEKIRLAAAAAGSPLSLGLTARPLSIHCTSVRRHCRWIDLNAAVTRSASDPIPQG